MQVERVLWGEIHAAVNRAAYAFPRPSATKLELGPNRYAIGLSTNEGVRFQGYHGQILIIIDEAPGVSPEIYEAIEGIRAGGDVRVLALGNPVIASGPFYDAFTENRESWNLITISAFDTPNLAGLRPESLREMSDHELDLNPYPYLTTRRWVKEKYVEWGPGHPLWESRVLGSFPTQSDESLLSLTWLEQAKLKTEGDGEVRAGIDVGGPGEAETVLCVRRGPRIVLLKAWTKSCAWGDVVAALLPFKSELKSVNVDAVGIGYGMARHLENEGFPVVDVNAGGSARDSAKYVNVKAEMYWGFRLRAESGRLAGLTDEPTIVQLVGIRYRHNPKGQIEIEKKEDARKRGVKSPDRAEAVILAFAELGSWNGLIEYERGEAEKIFAPAAPSVQPTCPKCGNGNLSAHGDSWRCGPCGAAGVIERKSIPLCPKCQSTAIARIGSEWHCNRCSLQFGNKAPIPNPLSRSEVLRRADAQGVFGRRR
jgi:ribosomal protein S27AE